MAYRIKDKEAVRKAVRRILRAQLKKAIEGGQQSSQPIDERVHLLRSRLKRARAAVDLVHRRAGSGAASDERWMREVARSLSKARDVAVQADTLHRLLEQNPDRMAAGADPSLRDIGSRLRRKMSPTTMEARVSDVVARLQKRRRRIGRWPVHHGRRALRQGLEAAYRRARRRMRKACDPTTEQSARAERMHGLRKSIKRLAMEVAVLRDHAPDLSRRLGGPLHELGVLLGEVHDLVVLRQSLERELGTPRDRRNRAILFELIDRRLAEVESAASAKSQETLALRPKLIRRMLSNV
ncbi:MAG TPA: CHAD domain-containing protein [Polyangia bacterium]|nr:CHAD domain-containing protein [Polyangia bacterium]